MTKMHAKYLGNLHCQAIHDATGTIIDTTGPTELGGTYSTFSPTDLIGASLATCMMTFLGITANKYKIDITGTTCDIDKEMIAAPIRRVGRIDITFNMAADIPEDKRNALELAAHTCPVHYSLHPDIEMNIKFVYPD